jgi:hypothetical protein
MSHGSEGAHEFEPWRLSKQELSEAIAVLETERESLEARCLVVRRRIALLRAERLARAGNAHFDAERVAEALLRRLPGLARDL